jgi:hypothetical protein
MLNGGIGADTLVAGRNTRLEGGAGKGVELTVAGSPTNLDHNTIAGFAQGVEKIALSEKGFGLMPHRWPLTCLPATPPAASQT